MIHGYISCLESKVDRAHTDKILPGADPGFQVRGCTLKNCAERRDARTFLGYSCEKNHDFKPKNHIFSNFKGGGGHVPGAPTPPGSAPDYFILKIVFYDVFIFLLFLVCV